MHTISSVTGWVLRDTGIGLLIIVVNLESRLRVKATRISGITGCNRERAAGGERSSDKGQQYHCIKGMVGLTSYAWGFPPTPSCPRFHLGQSVCVYGPISKWKPSNPISLSTPSSATAQASSSGAHGWIQQLHNLIIHDTYSASQA